MPARKRALICGVSGQDGSYLARLLLQQDYEVWGSSRDADLNSFQNLRRLNISECVKVLSLDLKNASSILAALRHIRPDEIFNLAGQTSVALSFDQPCETIESVAIGTLNLLEAIRLSDLDARLYSAGSSEIFGDTGDAPADENSIFRPRSPYAVAKASAFWAVRNYREAYGMFACTGIVSNHESPFRPLRFVTRKIIHAVAQLSLGETVTLKLGNLDIERDWGWAPDYVEAIARMLRQPQPTDMIIATGQSYLLSDFVDAAFSLCGLDWRDHVLLDCGLARPADISRSRLNPAKAAVELGWRARYAMRDVVEMMFEAELESLRSLHYAARC